MWRLFLSRNTEAQRPQNKKGQHHARAPHLPHDVRGRAFVMGGRHAMTSMGPQDVAERSKGATPGVAGGSILESVHID
jgi:hypothetical protein